MDNMATTELTNPQMEILNLMSFIKSPETLLLLKQSISDFFAQKAEDELNRLWENGELNDERIESFRNLHERTPYNWWL